MKKALVIAGSLIVVLLLTGYLFRDTIAMVLIASTMAPDKPFAETPAPPPPDYREAAAWAARPETTDPADALPDGAGPAPAPAVAKVFFVHPTTFMSAAAWNQQLDDAEANWIVDERVLRHQAAVFNGCCDVYAPRYRQATIYSFLDTTGDGARALELAYEDVAAAFAEFQTEIGPDAPFIIAGHSQGTSHATRLLRERIAGKPLQERLVAAYLVGFSVTEEQLGGVPVCASARDTGCVVAWNTVEGDAQGIFPDANLVCVNPLSWVTNDARVDRRLNSGGIGFPGWGPSAAEKADPTLKARMHVEPHVADAQCADGRLRVNDLHSESFPSRMPGGSLHVYDYSLFHMNVRRNAIARVSAFVTGG